MLKKCINDGVEFEATRSTARFCGDPCKKAYKRKGNTSDSRSQQRRKAISARALPSDKIELTGSDGKKTTAPSKVVIDDVEHALKPDGSVIPEKKVAEAKAPVLSDVEQRAQGALLTKAERIRRMNERLAARGAPLIQDKPDPVRFIATGIPALDALTADHDELKAGGFPRKHITEIFGPKGTGKTSLMKLIADHTDGLAVLYVDVEGGLICPPEHIVVSNATTVDDVETVVFEALREEEYDLIIVDSVAALSSAKEVEDAKSGFMTKAKDMARFIRRVNAIIRPIGLDGYPKRTAGTAVVFINQLRDTGNSFGVMEFTPGGRSIEYAASLRLELRSAKADRIIKDGVGIGQKVRVKVEKSRFGAPGMTTTFRLMYEELS